MGGSNPTGLTAFNGKLYFAADGDAAGTQLWQFDGHTATRLTDFDPAGGGGSPVNLTVSNGSLYFTAYVDVMSIVSGLFRYDGNSVSEVTAPGGGHLFGVFNLTSFDGDLYFTSGGQLWQLDGAQLTEITPLPGGHFSGASATHRGRPGPVLHRGRRRRHRIPAVAIRRHPGRSRYRPPGVVTGASPRALTVYDNSLYFTAYRDASSTPDFSV